MAGSDIIITNISSKEAMESAKKESEERLAVFFVFSAFHEPSAPGGRIHQLVEALAKANSGVKFFKIDADEFDEGVDELDVSAVPTFVFFQNNAEAARLTGAAADRLPDTIKRLQASAPTPATAPKEAATESKDTDGIDSALEARIRRLISAARVMVFMKGTPREPKCKFSRALMEVLLREKVRFGSFDILTDEAVRQGIKVVADWKTFPMVFLNGKLVGGNDVINEMIEDGSIADLRPSEDDKEAGSARDRYDRLIQSAPVFLFMKGSPEAPRCGFSARIVDLLQKSGISFASFDILRDEELRQKIKEFADWPTYPQLYANGKLVGGLDIVNEMAEDGDLKEQLGI